MRIAFYAPLKPPDHPVPSGDRRMAQLLFEALRLAGHEPFLVSRLRSYDGSGDTVRQARLARARSAGCRATLARMAKGAEICAGSLVFLPYLP